MSDKSYVWRFTRSGGFDQVRIDGPEDLVHLAELDPKLWAALACPTQGLVFDQATLDALDGDHDGRIRIPEVLAAIDFVRAALRDLHMLFGPDRLPLAALRDDTETGRRLAAAAQQLLKALALPANTALSLEHVADRSAIFPPGHANGDGLITVADLRAAGQDDLLQAIIDAQGSRLDRSGDPGVGTEEVAAFFARVEQQLAWWQAQPVHPAIDLARAWALTEPLLAKIDDYFARCRLAAFDARAAVLLDAREDQLSALATTLIAEDSPQARDLPLAHIDVAAILPLSDALNPAWSEAVLQLAEVVWRPLLGPIEVLSAADWKTVRGVVSAYGDWLQQQTQPSLDLAVADLVRYAEGDRRLALEQAIAADLAVADAADSTLELLTLLHYQRYLVQFLHNFVSFRDFYERRRAALFQAGRLYIDRRSCDLCVEVGHLDSYTALAAHSRTYLVYCRCTRAGAKDKIIVAAVSAGDAGQIMLGRHAVFYDQQGCDWDATIIKLDENPISVREAFWTPYRRMGNMVAEQMQKMAKAKEAGVQAQAMQDVTALGKGSAPPAFDVGRFAGIFAAIGLALGAIGTALASVATGFLSLHFWQMPLAVLAILGLISGPSMVLAWFKLRARNLGPILEGNGWAINSQARINIVFGTTLTQLATLPPGADRTLVDPYAAPRRADLWWWAALLVAAGGGVLFWLWRRHA